MNKEVKAALSGIKSAWKNMLTATDRGTYEFWRDEQLRLQKILYDERKRTLQRLRVNPTGESRPKRGRGRPRKTEAERRLRLQMYQHEYYLKVTKQKRAERRNNENTN